MLALDLCNPWIMCSRRTQGLVDICVCQTTDCGQRSPSTCYTRAEWYAQHSLLLTEAPTRRPVHLQSLAWQGQGDSSSHQRTSRTLKSDLQICTCLAAPAHTRTGTAGTAQQPPQVPMSHPTSLIHTRARIRRQWPVQMTDRHAPNHTFACKCDN